MGSLDEKVRGIGLLRLSDGDGLRSLSEQRCDLVGNRHRVNVSGWNYSVKLRADSRKDGVNLKMPHGMEIQGNIHRSVNLALCVEYGWQRFLCDNHGMAAKRECDIEYLPRNESFLRVFTAA